MAEEGRRPNRVAALELKLRILLEMNRPADVLMPAAEAQSLAEEIQAAPMLWRIHAARARAYRLLGDAGAAAEDERAAAEIVEALAERIPDPRHRQGFLDQAGGEMR